MEVSSQLHAPAALFPRMQSPVSNGYDAGWVQGRSGRYEENTLLSLPKIETRVLGRPARRLVAIRTDLSGFYIHSYRPRHLGAAFSFTADRPVVSLVTPLWLGPQSLSCKNDL
jgi:hypothetical protein